MKVALQSLKELKSLSLRIQVAGFTSLICEWFLELQVREADIAKLSFAVDLAEEFYGR